MHAVCTESIATLRQKSTLRHRLRGAPGSDVTSGYVTGSSSLRMERASSSARCPRGGSTVTGRHVNIAFDIFDSCQHFHGFNVYFLKHFNVLYYKQVATVLIANGRIAASTYRMTLTRDISYTSLWAGIPSKIAILDTCPLRKFEGCLNLLHQADDDTTRHLDRSL